MEVLLRRFYWVVNLGLIALGSLLAAHGTSSLIEKAYLVGDPATSSTRGGGPGVPGAGGATSRSRWPPEPAAAPRSKDVAPILDRNMFCSACLPVVEKPDESESSSPVATSLPLTLLATIVSPKDPTWSMAAIRDNNTRDSALYRLGQEVPGAAVDGIEDTRVYLKVGGHIEYLDLLAAAQPAEKSHDMSIGGGDPHGILADLDRGVRKLSETEYQLDRKLLDKVLGNTQMLATSARIVPAIKDGKPNGFKLYAIRPNSVYGRIGLQNGDTVHAINGHEISTPDAALSVYQKVKSASHISVSLTRRGQTTTLDYTVR